MGIFEDSLCTIMNKKFSIKKELNDKFLFHSLLQLSHEVVQLLCLFVKLGKKASHPSDAF